MSITPTATTPSTSSAPTPTLEWLPRRGVRAADGHELPGHPLDNERCVYVDSTAKRALVCEQRLGDPPTSSRLISERAPTATEQARIVMSNLSGQRGRAFDGATSMGNVSTDTIGVRGGRRVATVIDARFETSAADQRIYVFDITDEKLTRFPLIGCYDLA